ncbi:class C sortase [Bifidobacterium dolichotidis]|nr:class C sortase [Bifidobacterium dolichotidis]
MHAAYVHARKPWTVDPNTKEVGKIAARQRSIRRRMLILRIVGIILGIGALCIAATPFILQWKTAANQSSQTQSVHNRVAGWPYPKAEEQLQAAQKYNKKLAASGQPILGEAVDPFASVAGSSSVSGHQHTESAASKDAEYQSLLDTGDGVMGAIVIPKISVNLPIYHGTDDAALSRGAGHLYGTSLPVGGKNTHAVITGHRGLVAAAMFTRLDEMKKGDFFYIDVMGKELGYEVDRISVIDPSDVSSLRVEPGQDRVTLMTCTPYGVNTHRLLVSGHRVSIPNPAPHPSDVYDLHTIGICTVLAILVFGSILAGVWKRWHRFIVMHHAGKNRPAW